MMANEDISSVAKKLFDSVKTFNYEECKLILTESKVNPNFCDEDRMSPLQHAAYCGKNDLCKLLLEFGADPNYTEHSSNYSALTFAGIAGYLDCVKTLLEYGANVKAVNSINKTAAQMSAFVGNHDVVSVINNFIPIEDVEKISSKVPSLQNLSKEIHKLAIITNIHPVAIVFYLQNNIAILNKSQKASKLFKFLSEIMLSDEGGNELMSIKFHHISFIIDTCHSFLSENKGHKDPTDALNALIKYWIKGDKNGFPVVLEKLLRDDIAKYPYGTNTLFQDLLKTLSPVNVGEEPSALSVILDVTKHPDNATYCATCGASPAEKKCSACKSVSYCDKKCQKLHWFTHKTLCSDLLKEWERKTTAVRSAVVSETDKHKDQDPLLATTSSVSSSIKSKDQE